MGNPVDEAKQYIGTTPAYILIVVLSPVFFAAAILYMALHAGRVCERAETVSAGELAVQV